MTNFYANFGVNTIGKIKVPDKTKGLTEPNNAPDFKVLSSNPLNYAHLKEMKQKSKEKEAVTPTEKKEFVNTKTASTTPCTLNQIMDCLQKTDKQINDIKTGIQKTNEKTQNKQIDLDELYKQIKKLKGETKWMK